jgi:hypothetical protein
MERKSYNKYGWRLLKGHFWRYLRGVMAGMIGKKIRPYGNIDEYLEEPEERKEIKRDGKKNDHLSISFCWPYSRFFFMPPSSCFRY